jgi:hypothetical protein
VDALLTQLGLSLGADQSETALLVVDVKNGSAADQSGIERGDRLVSVDGVTLSTSTDLSGLSRDVTHQFEFLKPAKTSRGEYTEKTSHLVSLRSGGFEGIGEAAPLPGLSLDGDADYHAFTKHLLNVPLDTDDILEHLDLWEPGKDTALPAMRFAMHAAWQHLQHLLSQPSLLNSPKMPSHWVNTPFTQGKAGMKINGLVWMNGINAMYEEAMLKISLGFRCIKIKVGALDFDEECKLIEKLRKHTNAFQLEIRLDANGGFSHDVALEQIKAFVPCESNPDFTELVVKYADELVVAGPKIGSHGMTEENFLSSFD